MIRTDAAVIKHLAQTVSQEAAHVYNRLPVFIMPSEADELLKNERELLDVGPETLRPPFSDFILDFPFGTTALTKSLGMPSLGRGRLWVRVRSTSELRHTDPATTINAGQIAFVKTLREGLYLEGWEEKTLWATGLPPYPDYSLISVETDLYRNFETYLHVYPNTLCEKERCFGKGIGWCNIARCVRPGTEAHMRCHGSELIQATMCRLIVLSLIYIDRGFGGATTRVSWTPRKGSKDLKTERIKPWLVPRRESYIIIDPARAHEYGHPSSIPAAGPGHHASPVPHARRGHMRRLSQGRETWVRPTWVGATEWQSEGRTYKIIMPGGEKSE